MSLRDDYCRRASEWFERSDQMALNERPTALDIANSWLKLAISANRFANDRPHRTIDQKLRLS
jgi:hypothetical protein